MPVGTRCEPCRKNSEQHRSAHRDTHDESKGLCIESYFVESRNLSRSEVHQPINAELRKQSAKRASQKRDHHTFGEHLAKQTQLACTQGFSNARFPQTPGKSRKKQIREIAEKKMPDLNANTIEAAEKIVAGTARSMGVEVIE